MDSDAHSSSGSTSIPCGELGGCEELNEYCDEEYLDVEMEAFGNMETLEEREYYEEHVDESEGSESVDAMEGSDEEYVLQPCLEQ